MVVELLSPQVMQGAASEFLRFLLRLVYAVVVVVVGWIIGSVIAGILDKILEKIKFEEFLKSHKVHDTLGSTKVSKVLVQLAKYYVILLFLADALKIVQLGTVGNLMNSVVNFAPVALGGALVVILAAMLGELVKEKILEISNKSSLTTLSAKVVKALFIYVGFVIAMGTMGFDVVILEQTFVTLIQALAYGIALAFAIAFGLGAQDDAKDIVKKTRKKFNL